MLKKISNYKNIVYPSVVIGLIVVLSLFVGNFLMGKINTLKAQTQELEGKNEVLQNRLATLENVENEITEDVLSATLAIPTDSPAVYVVNVIRKISTEQNIGIQMLSINARQTPDELENIETTKAYDISFEANASDFTALTDFVNSLSEARPLLNLQSVVVQRANNGPGVDAQISLNAYSAPFPQTLPNIDEPLFGLSPGEQETLTLLESFTSPEFVSGDENEVNELAPRENPFNLEL